MFFTIDIKYLFSCGKSNLYLNLSKFQNIMSAIVVKEVIECIIKAICFCLDQVDLLEFINATSCPQRNMCRSSRQQLFCRIAVMRTFAKFTGKNTSVFQ